MLKPLLLMIHGLVGSLNYFTPQSLISNARVRTLDLLGYGIFADIDLRRLTMAGQADHVVRTIRSMDSKQVWLLGHSMGGAVAMLVAARVPELIAGIINVEGNFTLKDAFWSQNIAKMELACWSDKYEQMQSDIPGWLLKCGIEPDAPRLAMSQHILENQPPSTVHAMSQAIIEETGDPAYQGVIREVIEQGIPVYLIAGETSAAAWDVPDFVRTKARSYFEQADAGHLMMLEDSDLFCRIVDSILGGEERG